MDECTTSGNNIELTTTQKTKATDKVVKKGMPEYVMRLFGLLPKKKTKKEEE